MANIQDQIAQAKAAGYSDQDIAQHLSNTPDYGGKIKTALDAGYKAPEIISFLNSAPEISAEDQKQNKINGIVKATSGNGLAGGLTEAAANMISGGIANVAGNLTGLAMIPIDYAANKLGYKGDIDTDPTHAKNTIENAFTYQPTSDSGKVISAYNPLALLSKGAAYVGDKAGNLIAGGNHNDVDAESLRGMAGNATAEAIKQAAAFIPIHTIAGKFQGKSPVRAIDNAPVDTASPSINYDIPTYLRNGIKPVEQNVPTLPEASPVPISALEQLAQRSKIASPYGELPPNPVLFDTEKPSTSLDQYIADQEGKPNYLSGAGGSEGIADLLRQEANKNVVPIDRSPLDKYLAGDGSEPINPDLKLNPSIEQIDPTILNQTLPKNEVLPTFEKPTIQELNESDLASLRHSESESLPVNPLITEGQATGNLSKLSNEQNMRGAFPELSERFNNQNKALIDNTTEFKNQVSPNINPTDTLLDHSQALIDAYKSMDQASQNYISKKYQALADANGGELPINAKKFVDNTDRALNTDDMSSFVPSEIKSLLDKYRNGADMTFDKFESMRTILARAQRSTLDGNVRNAIGVVRNELENLPLSDVAAPLKPLADEARQAARERFQKIESDPAYRAITKDETPINEPSPLADKFFKNYVINGKSANITKLINNLGDNPLVNQRIAAGTIEHLRDMAGIDLRTNQGNFSQSQFNNAIEKLVQDHKLDQVVGQRMANQIKTLGNVARYTQFQPKGSFINNSNTLVANGMKATKGAIEGAANYVAHGIPVGTLIGKALTKMTAQKIVNNALKERAGVIEIKKPTPVSTYENSLRTSGVPYAKKVQSIMDAPTIDDAINRANEISR